MTRHITNTISQQFGKFASHPFAPWFQKIVNHGYVRIMGLDMSEFDPPSDYPTLNALFTRRLKAPRPLDETPEAVVSPCDSLVTASGKITGELALQIKGMSYRVDPFLGERIDEESRAAVIDGDYINLYLSPSDYHRYHIPVDVQVLRAVHIPGKLYPVNFPSLRKRSNLFIENERVVIECLLTNGKRLFIVLVGALNVGKMQVAFEPRIQTNADTTEPTVYTFDDLHLKKGDDFGCFEMGSTVVLLAEKGAMEILMAEGNKVRFGEKIAKLRG